MRLINAVAIIIAIALAGTIGFAQEQGRAVQDRYTFEYLQAPFINCADYGVGEFWVMGDLAGTVHDMTFFGEDGNPTQRIENSRFTRDVLYNSTDWNKRLVLGPGENQQNRLTFEDGVMVTNDVSGPMFKLIIPGYGPLLMETGHASLDFVNGAWVINFNTGHNGYLDINFFGDSAGPTALCNYLK